MAFFEELGIPCTADEAGRVYPMSNQAASVLDALRLCCDEQGVDTRINFAVVRLERSGRGFEAVSQEGERVRGRCSGGCSPDRRRSCVQAHSRPDCHRLSGDSRRSKHCQR